MEDEMTLADLKRSADGLSETDRAELADYLLASLDSEADVAAAWRDELGRRMADIRSGKETGVPAEDVLRRLQEKYP